MTNQLPQGDEPLAGGAGPGMLRPKRLVANGKRALIECQCFLMVSLVLLKRGEIVEGLSGVGVLRTEPPPI